MRLNDSILGQYESALLHWLCGRIPTRISSNHLTFLGLAGGVVIFTGFALSQFSLSFLWLVILGLALNWAGDSLDGSLARFRGCERPKYGFFMDHMADSFTMTLVGVGASLSPILSLASCLSTLIAYLLLTVFSVLEAKARDIMRISFCKIGPTEFRIFLAILVVLMFFFPQSEIELLGVKWNPYDAVLFTLAAAMLIVCIFAALQIGRELSREDP